MAGRSRHVGGIFPLLPGGMGLGIRPRCWCRLCTGCPGPGKVLAQPGIGGIDDLEFFFGGKFFPILIQITIRMPLFDQRLVGCPQICSATTWLQPQDLVVMARCWWCSIGHAFQYLRSRCLGIDNGRIAQRRQGLSVSNAPAVPVFMHNSCHFASGSMQRC